MMFLLKTITKRRKSFVFSIEVNFLDEIYCVEMLKRRLNSNSMYLYCSSTNCEAKESVIVKQEIPIEKVGGSYYKI